MFQSTIWEPENCIYGQSVRTKNDVEGWHRRLNFLVNGTPPFYVLVDLLHREARVEEMQVQLTDGKLRRYQERTNKSMQTRIFKCWREYDNGQLSTSRLLKAIAEIYGPTVTRTDE